MTLGSLSIAEGKDLVKSTFIKWGLAKKKCQVSEITRKNGEITFQFGEIHPRIREITAPSGEI